MGDDGRSFAYSIDTTDSVSLILANEARIDLDERGRRQLERWGAVVEEVDRLESEFAQLQIISFPAQVEDSGELVLPARCRRCLTRITHGGDDTVAACDALLGQRSMRL